jgi:hypothetical protein
MPQLSDVQAGRIGEYLLAAFSSFRTETKNVGPRLLEIINALPPATEPLPGARLLLTRR